MATTWTEALAAYVRATAITNAIDSDKHEDAFDQAASAQGKAIMALLTTPAPDLAAVATKLQVIHRDGYQHELAPVLADVERMAGLERGLANASLLEDVIAQHAEAERVFEAAVPDDEDAEDAFLASLHVLDSYVPMTPLEFVRAFSVRFANGLPPSDDMTERLVEIARDLADRPHDVDPHVAWLTERNTLIEYLDSNAPTEDEANTGVGRLNEIDGRIIKTPATTATGVFAKLLLAVQLSTEGQELIEADAAAFVREVQAVTGMGRVSPNVAARREL